jgi:D-arabinose 1-dehydrogenase-like Zn-dependent alcohol dehydrogenase
MNYLAHEPLPETMSAIVCHGPQDYRYQEWQTPEPGAGEIVIRVRSVGICASDLKCYQGAPDTVWINPPIERILP